MASRAMWNNQSRLYTAVTSIVSLTGVAGSDYLKSLCLNIPQRVSRDAPSPPPPLMNRKSMLWGEDYGHRLRRGPCGSLWALPRGLSTWTNPPEEARPAMTKSVTLRNGVEMPLLGYGTWRAGEGELEPALEAALKCGYRHIDTAAFYGNEGVIGKVLEDWIAAGNGARKDIFLVTKLPPVDMWPSGVEKCVARSLRELRTEYLDLFLIHAPMGFMESDDMVPLGDDGKVLLNNDVDLVAVWKAMEEQVDKGRVKAIGVSNFSQEQLQRILDNCRIRPANLQIELHVYMQQRPLVAFCAKNDIVVTAYSPLGSRGVEKLFAATGIDASVPDLLSNPVVLEVAARLGRTPAQVLLRHIVRRGIVAIPKSTNEDRIAQNFQVFDFELSTEDVEKLDALDMGDAGRIVTMTFLPGVENHPEYPW